MDGARFGKVDQVPGVLYVVSDCNLTLGIPLPQRTLLVVESSGEEISLPFEPKSIFYAYLRYGLLTLGLLLIPMAYMDAETPPTLASFYPVPICWLIAWASLWWSRADRPRALELAKIAGIQPEIIHQALGK